MTTIISALLFAAARASADDPPRAVDARLKIELFAEHPQLRTPSGIDVDHRGRVWAIESNTHFRPEEYDGHASDRVLVMTDTDGDGRADEIVTFADGLTHTMSVAVRPVWLGRVEGQGSRDKSQQEGVESVDGQQDSGTRPSTLDSQLLQVFLATRAAIYLYENTDGDLRADRRTRLVHLDTKGDYPHNGLAGFAFDALGWMYFGFGENLGEPYKIIGSDGTTLSGGGEGGNVYRSKPDGSQLALWATGFWNPHASCVDAFGRLFTVDNDPDSRPPCRLLHVIEGGDYGYRFRNGRKGTHPFTSWNGEIPGTLPMVSGTGESPSGIVAYESDGLPEDYLGNLIVTSWGDHRIDRFRLKPKGASFESLAEPIIQGGENFRPVGLALAPDGSLYCTDWVLRDYKLHGKARVWRISAAESVDARDIIDLATITPLETAREERHKLLGSSRVDVRRQAASTISDEQLIWRATRTKFSERERIEALWALARRWSDKEFRERLSPDVFPHRIADAVTQQWSVLIWGANTTAVDPVSAASLAIDSFPVGKQRRIDRANRLLDGVDPFVFAAVVKSLPRAVSETRLRALFQQADITAQMRLGYLLALRRDQPHNQSLAMSGLSDPSPIVRRAAVQWVGEEKLNDLRPQLEAVLHSEPMTTDLLLATLAALDMLDGVPPAEFEKQPPAKYLLPIVRDDQRPGSLRATALRLLPPGAEGLDVKLLSGLMDSEQAALRLEAVRTLQTDASDPAQELLRRIAADETRARDLRAEAVLGLAAPGQDLSQKTIDVLSRLFHGTEPALQIEAMRSLRAETANGGEGLQAILYRQITRENASEHLRREEVRRQLDLILEQPARHELDADRPHERYLGGDAAAGRRVFFHPMSAGCSKCHSVEGRGGHVGPDLSTIGRLGRAKLIESILEPSKEVAPQFTAWSLVTRAGQVRTGLIVHEDAGQTTIGDAEGRTVTIPTLDIVERVPQRISVMPEKLHERMTVGEFRDLIAYLESLK